MDREDSGDRSRQSVLERTIADLQALLARRALVTYALPPSWSGTRYLASAEREQSTERLGLGEHRVVRVFTFESYAYAHLQVTANDDVTPKLTVRTSNRRQDLKLDNDLSFDERVEIMVDGAPVMFSVSRSTAGQRGFALLEDCSILVEAARWDRELDGIELRRVTDDSEWIDGRRRQLSTRQ